MPAPHHSVFTGRMPFLPPNQQRQSTKQKENSDYSPEQMQRVSLGRRSIYPCVCVVGELPGQVSMQRLRQSDNDVNTTQVHTDGRTTLKHNASSLITEALPAINPKPPLL